MYINLVAESKGLVESASLEALLTPRSRAISIFASDFTTSGGFPEVKKMAHTASAFEVVMAPGHRIVSVVGNAHLPIAKFIGKQPFLGYGSLASVRHQEYWN